MANRRKVPASTVFLWNHKIGAVAWDENRGTGTFQYTPEFVKSGLEVAPIRMPLQKNRIYSFPELNRETFYGLPGMLSDALPDRYGNALINIWLAQQGRDVNDFSPVERLCYMGTRAMGALEFKPATGPQARKAIPVEIAELTQIASDILKKREAFIVNMEDSKAKALKRIIRVGTSAGGARAKAVIAWNPGTNEVRSGQVPAPEGFEPWLLKFDGVNYDLLGNPEGFGKVEYAYYLMALNCGIEMSKCHLLKEDGRAHFMTRRFDRGEHGKKIHMQSLCAMGHYDFNRPGEYSYEQALGIIQKLNLGHPAMQELFRRMVFNILARNHDDHTRNIAFLMDRKGNWRLSPAYDMIWSYKADSPWVSRHQMCVNGKQDNITIDDILAVANQYMIKNSKEIFLRVHDSVSRWEEFACQAKVEPDMIKAIGSTHRTQTIHI